MKEKEIENDITIVFSMTCRHPFDCIVIVVIAFVRIYLKHFILYPVQFTCKCSKLIIILRLTAVAVAAADNEKNSFFFFLTKNSFQVKDLTLFNYCFKRFEVNFKYNLKYY